MSSQADSDSGTNANVSASEEKHDENERLSEARKSYARNYYRKYYAANKNKEEYKKMRREQVARKNKLSKEMPGLDLRYKRSDAVKSFIESDKYKPLPKFSGPVGSHRVTPISREPAEPTETN